MVPRILREILFFSLCISTGSWHAEKKSFTNRRRKWSHETVKSNSYVGRSLHFCQVTNLSWPNFRLSKEHWCRDNLEGNYYYDFVFNRNHSSLIFDSIQVSMFCLFLESPKNFLSQKSQLSNKQQSACFEKLSFHMLLEKTRGLQNRLKKFRDLWWSDPCSVSNNNYDIIIFVWWAGYKMILWQLTSFY